METIFKREDGTRVKLIVWFSNDPYKNGIRWEFRVETCKSGKRKFYDPVNTDDYRFRALSLEDRRIHTKSEYYKIVTDDEVRSTQLKLWESLKP